MSETDKRCAIFNNCLGHTEGYCTGRKFDDMGDLVACWVSPEEATEISEPKREQGAVNKKDFEDAIGILKCLADELLPLWHSECNCYSVESMKKTEYQIDDFLERLTPPTQSE